MHHPTDRIIHTTAFVTPVVEHWLEREIAQWVVRSECTFRASCCSARLSRAQVPGHEKKRAGSKRGECVCVCGGGGGVACTGRYKEVRAIRSESVAGGGNLEIRKHSLINECVFDDSPAQNSLRNNLDH